MVSNYPNMFPGGMYQNNQESPLLHLYCVLSALVSVPAYKVCPWVFRSPTATLRAVQRGVFKRGREFAQYSFDSAVKESEKQRLFALRFLLAPGAARADARPGAPSPTHAPEVGTPGPLPANQHPGPGSDPHLVFHYCPISERV